MKKTYALLLILALLAALLTGCAENKLPTLEPPDSVAIVEEQPSTPAGEETPAAPATEETPSAEPETDPEEYYRELLDHFWTLITENEAWDEEAYGVTGVWEVANYSDTQEALDTVGYTVQDLSGDGVPELIVAAVNEDGTAGEIFACYTLDAETKAPVGTFEGWSRSRHQWLGDGSFYIEGSSGAAYTMFGVSELTPDGRELKCRDLYFTWESDDASGLEFYHNTTGVWDPKEAEKLDVSDEEFWAVSGELCQPQPLALTPFSAYREYVPAAEPVSVRWGDEVLSDLSDYEVFQVPGGETEIVFLPGPEGLQNFKFLGLTFVDADENGNIKYNMEQLYEIETLEKPLCVKTTLVGTIPNNGISFTDGEGNTRCFAVQESGYDGSLQLEEFNP